MKSRFHRRPSADDLIAARLNDDEWDDIIVFTHFDASQIQGLLLLSHCKKPQ